jgi:hypothetical protein
MMRNVACQERLVVIVRFCWFRVGVMVRCQVGSLCGGCVYSRDSISYERERQSDDTIAPESTTEAC